MVMRYFRRLERVFRFLLLCLLKKVAIGKYNYSVPGYYRNKFAIAARDADMYEEWAENIFGIIFSLRQGRVIDVGANVGQTMIRVLSLDRDRQYIGFEPQVSGCFFIQDFILRNGLENHTIIQGGLSDKSGIVKLGLRHQYDQAASVISEYRPDDFYSFFQYVPVFSGDDILPLFNIESISLLKIDVEGGELEVLLGMRQAIEKYKPYIIFEVLPNYLLSTGEKLADDIIVIRNKRNAKIDEFLRKYGYVIYQLPIEGGFLVIEEIKASSKNLGDLISNYVAVPKEESCQFEKLYSSV